MKKIALSPRIALAFALVPVLALSLALAGCPAGAGPPGDPNGPIGTIPPAPPRSPNALFDLAHDPHFQSLSAGETGLAFPGLPLGPSHGVETEVAVGQVTGGGTRNLLRVAVSDDWTGIDLLHSMFGFEAGDIVSVAGIAQTANQMRLQTPGNNWSWLAGMPGTAGGAFAITHALSAENMTFIAAANPQAIRVRGGVVNAIFTITELTVIRPGGLPPVGAIEVTAAGDARTIRAGEVLQFTAAMQGRPFQAFAWDINPPVPGVEVSGSGLLSARDTVPANTQVTVRATAVGATVSGTATVTVAAALPILWMTYQNYFPLGNIIASASWSRHTMANSPERVNILTRNFNILTAPNEMKPDVVRHSAAYPGTWHWAYAEQLMRLAEANNMRFHGHCLVWHAQTPRWLVPENIGRTEAIRRLEGHVETVMRHIGNRVESWDVLNEVIASGGPYWHGNAPRDDPNWDWRLGLRDVRVAGDEMHPDANVDWRREIGDDLVEIAFRAARRVANENSLDIILYYNDYNLSRFPVKMHAVYRMVRDINERHRDPGHPYHHLVASLPNQNLIQAIGTQAHYSYTDNYIVSPDRLVENMRNTLLRFASLGVYVSVTELTLGVGTSGQEGWERRQAITMARFFNLFKSFATEHPGVLRRVTLWGLDDADTWRPDSRGHLWDENLQPKEAFHAVADPRGFLERHSPSHAGEFAGDSFPLPDSGFGQPALPPGPTAPAIPPERVVWNMATVLAGGVTGATRPLQSTATASVADGGVNVTGRSAGWHGLDLWIDGANLNLNPASNIYIIHVGGRAIGAPPANAQIYLQGANGRDDEGWPWIGGSGSLPAQENAAFQMSLPLPADFLELGPDGQSAIRIQTNVAGAAMSFRVAYIIVERVGPRTAGSGAGSITVEWAGFTNPIPASIDVSVAGNSATLTVNAPPSELSNIRWVHDGAPAGEAGPSLVLTGLQAGIHMATVRADRGGRTYSRIVPFTVPGH